MDIKQYLEILWRRAWVLALSMILAGTVAYVGSRMQRPVYRTMVTLLISEAPSGKMSDITSLMTSERLARTYVEMMKARPILEQVVSRLGFPFGAAVLSRMVRVEVVKDTQLIRLVVDDFDPARAAVVANLLPEVFIEYNKTTQSSRFAESQHSLSKEIAALDEQVVQMQAQINSLKRSDAPDSASKIVNLESDLTRLRQSRAGLVQSYENQRLVEAQTINNVVVIEAASVPLYPIRPRPLVNTALAIMLGLALAVGLVLLIEYLDDSIKTADQLTAVMRLPVIGVLARLPAKDFVDAPIASKKPRAPITEAFRSLRANIQFAGIDRPLHRILVTSVGPQEGKSTVAANLAVVLAQAGHMVALLDCDLHRPVQHVIFAQKNRNGLSDIILQDPLCIDSALLPLDVPNLSLLTAGVLPPNSSELLGSKKMGQLLDMISQKAEIIVIDSPPISILTDATVLANKTDGVVLVVEVGSTSINGAMHAKQQLERAGAPIIGVVLNKAPITRGGYYYYQYNYSDTHKGFRGVVNRIRSLFKRRVRINSKPESPDGIKGSSV